MTVSWWTVYLLDQLSRRVSGNDKREGNQYYNVLPVSSENGLDDRESLSHPHTGRFSVRTPMCVLIYGYASLQNEICRIFAPTWHNWQWNHTQGMKHTGHTAWVNLPKYCIKKAHVLILREYCFCCFSMTQLVLTEFITFLIVSFFQLWHLCWLCSLLSHIYWTGGQTSTQTLSTIQPGSKASQYLQSECSVRRGSKHLDTRHFYSQLVPE